MKIHHFAIKVKDIDKSIAFYVEKLGFEIVTPKSFTSDGLYAYANLDLKGAELELEEELKEIKRDDITLGSCISICPHIGLETNNFDKDFQDLQKKGIKIFDGPHVIENDVKMVTILDPEGYRIDIGQLLK